MLPKQIDIMSIVVAMPSANSDVEMLACKAKKNALEKAAKLNWALKQLARD